MVFFKGRFPKFISVGRFFLVRNPPWSNFQPLDGAIFLWVYITKPFHFFSRSFCLGMSGGRWGRQKV